ncbi:TPA: nucleoside recognition domain-containing protein [Pseudomonas aeruginosa]
MLNGLWLGFFLVAAASALARWLIGGDATVFAAMVESLFAMAKLAVEVMVLLFGTLTLWLGFLRIAEKAGLVERLAVLLGPLFRRLMPEVPPGHPAIGLITLNFAANGLGLDNAATPIGLKAMKALQELNPSSTTASNAQILFLVLNASSLTLLPVTIFMYRAQQGAADPTLVFLPILLATSASTLAGLLSVALMQRLRLWDPVVLAYLIPGALLLAGFMAVLGTLSATALALLTAYPALSWLVREPSFAGLLGVELWLSFLYSSYNGAMVVALTEVMPADVRTTGFSLAYSLATATFGGFTPAVCTWLIHTLDNRAAPGIWLSGAALLGLLATLVLFRRRGKEIAEAELANA